jgi:hypothetical protein
LLAHDISDRRGVVRIGGRQVVDELQQLGTGAATRTHGFDATHGLTAFLHEKLLASVFDA